MPTPATPNTQTITVSYDATTQKITVSPAVVEILQGGTLTFVAPGNADMVVICGDNSSHPASPSAGWFANATDQGRSARNDVAVFVQMGSSRDIAVKGPASAITAPLGYTTPNYDYSIVILTSNPITGDRDKVLHDEDPTVIIRDR